MDVKTSKSMVIVIRYKNNWFHQRQDFDVDVVVVIVVVAENAFLSTTGQTENAENRNLPEKEEQMLRPVTFKRNIKGKTHNSNDKNKNVLVMSLSSLVHFLCSCRQPIKRPPDWNCPDVNCPDLNCHLHVRSLCIYKSCSSPSRNLTL